MTGVQACALPIYPLSPPLPILCVSSRSPFLPCVGPPRPKTRPSRRSPAGCEGSRFWRGEAAQGERRHDCRDGDVPMDGARGDQGEGKGGCARAITRAYLCRLSRRSASSLAVRLSPPRLLLPLSLTVLAAALPVRRALCELPSTRKSRPLVCARRSSPTRCTTTRRTCTPLASYAGSCSPETCPTEGWAPSRRPWACCRGI